MGRAYESADEETCQGRGSEGKDSIFGFRGWRLAGTNAWKADDISKCRYIIDRTRSPSPSPPPSSSSRCRYSRKLPGGPMSRRSSRAISSGLLYPYPVLRSASPHCSPISRSEFRAISSTDRRDAAPARKHTRGTISY